MSVDDPLLTDDARGLVADLTVRKRWDIRISAVRESISGLRALVAAARTPGDDAGRAAAGGGGTSQPRSG
jgi:hypothetical protein